MRTSRFVSALAVLSVSAGAFAQSAPKPANTLLAAAKVEARAQKKSIFVVFHASW